MQHQAKQPNIAALSFPQINGSPNTEPPIPSLIPKGKSTRWQGVHDGKSPPSVKLVRRTTAWKSVNISALIESLNATETGSEQ